MSRFRMAALSPTVTWRTLRPRERRLALIAAVVIVCWGCIAWLMEPLWQRLRALHIRIAGQTEKMEGLSRLLAQAPAIEREYQGLAPYLAGGEEAQAPDAFLNDLETLSRTLNLQLNLKPRPVKREDRMSRFEVEVDLEGPQQSLLAFLDALFQMPRLMTIDRLRISTVPAKENILRANLVVHQLTLSSS